MGWIATVMGHVVDAIEAIVYIIIVIIVIGMLILSLLTKRKKLAGFLFLILWGLISLQVGNHNSKNTAIISNQSNSSNNTVISNQSNSSNNTNSSSTNGSVSY